MCVPLISSYERDAEAARGWKREKEKMNRAEKEWNSRESYSGGNTSDMASCSAIQLPKAILYFLVDFFFDRRRRHRETIRLDRDHSLLFSRRGQDDSVAHLLHQVDVRARSSSDAGKSWKHALVFLFHYY